MNQNVINEENYKISVVISVYKNDIAENFKIAVNSILNQTYYPSEIILIVDGPVSQEINKLIIKYEENSLFRIFRFKDNQGLGKALEFGCNNAKYPIIARMDSDDISEPYRFEKQINYLKENPECDVVGTMGDKFSNFNNKKYLNKLPTTDAEIKKCLKKRCPLNHMSVLMKKSTLMKCGNYKDWYLAEDYYLWIRMCLSGAVFYSIPEKLVKIRFDKCSLLRRHGIKYFKSIASLFKLMHKNKIINLFSYYKNIIVRFVYHVLIPVQIKYLFYK